MMLGFESLFMSFQVAFDMRGHGRSGMPTDLADYTSRLYADDFALVTKAFGLTRPIFLGWYVPLQSYPDYLLTLGIFLA